jgi:hypothetical protein
MTAIVAVGLIQLLAPLALIAWLFTGRPNSLAVWLSRVLLTAGLIGAVAVAGLWLLVPWAIVYLDVALFAAGAWVAWRRTWPRRWRPAAGGTAAALALTGLAAAAVLAVLSYGLAGHRRPKGRAVDLSFPLRGGLYYIANGGSNGLVNPHLLASHAAGGALRGQSYGVDIVEVSALGLRARGLLPSDPSRYRIFGAPVYAPCRGRVERATDTYPDLPVPQKDAVHPVGNFVLLRCADYDVLLAHLQQGSVRVSPGDRVAPSDPALARVGSSGNGIEPHLHIHAQKPATGGSTMAAAPVPMLFGGKFLVRNQRIRIDAPR